MSMTTPLTDLANFVGRAEKKTASRASQANTDFWQAYAEASAHPERRPVSARVTDLLGVVMTISARTRRLVTSPVNIELDVFSPNGNRAVHLIMGPHA